MLSRVGVLGCWGDGAAGVALEYAEKCLDIAGKYYVKEHPEFLNYRGNYGVVLKAQVCPLTNCSPSTDQSQSLDRNIPHPSTNSSPLIGIYLTHRLGYV
eukprot:40527-Pyramimonas_sp.AAC.1